MRRLLVLCGRILLIATTVAGVAGGLALAAKRPEPAMPALSALTPTVLAGGLLVIIHHGYLAVRDVRWRRRRWREARELAKLDLPDDLDPALFDDVGLIDAAQHGALPDAPDYQGRMYARGVTVAALPALAVLVAALPMLRPDNGAWATGSSVAEFLALALVMFLVRRNPSPSRGWVQARTRAELLRREQYLRLARVGPYLNLAEAAAAEVVAQRLARLAPSAEAPPTDLIAMRDPATGRRWLDLFWTSAPSPLADLPRRARSYLHYRIDKQAMWFRLGVADARATERLISGVINASLVGAMAVIAGQIALPPLGLDTPPYPAFATLLALALPPLGAFLIAIRELYTYRARSTSYAHSLDALRSERQALVALIDRIDDPTADREAVTREFQAFVLHVEATLTAELETWIMITERDRYDIDV